MTFLRLDKCDGPPCPTCGCQDGEILRPPIPDTAEKKTWFGSGLARCGYCGREFHFREVPIELEQLPPAETAEAAPVLESLPVDPPPPVERKTIPIVKCPDCETQMKITRTLKAVRYHKCPKCGETAKTAR